jgi:hypothetical protein
MKYLPSEFIKPFINQCQHLCPWWVSLPALLGAGSCAAASKAVAQRQERRKVADVDQLPKNQP